MFRRVFGLAALCLATACSPTFDRPACYSAYECSLDAGAVDLGSEPDAADAEVDGGGEPDARQAIDAGVLAGQWAPVVTSTNPPARAGAATAYSPIDRALVIAGGCGRTEIAPCREAWAFRGDGWSPFTAAIDFTPGRRSAVLAETEAGELLIFGGENAATGAALADSWHWNGLSWSSVQSPSNPDARLGAAGAYDPVHRTIVLFGGAACATEECEIFGDTCRFEDGRWSCAMLDGPSARRGHTMAYDSANGRIILFGGRDAAGYLADTWFFDGANWSAGPTTGSSYGEPEARSGHTLGFDAIRGIAVLFGGETGDPAAPVLEDKLWELHHDYWVPVTTNNGPSARTNAAMGFDIGGGGMVLFGGDDGATVLGDSWIYSGAR